MINESCLIIQLVFLVFFFFFGGGGGLVCVCVFVCLFSVVVVGFF